MSALFSNSGELERIARIVKLYTRLPISTDMIPGAFVEAALAHVRKARILPTYDYVDVYSEVDRLGWSVKSTKEATPMTWKRAKIKSKGELIKASHGSADALQHLGDSIIEFCNIHARMSIEKYDLDEIGYARLILRPNDRATYFERTLCSRESPDIFNPADFRWTWSAEKNTKDKEQLSALHGWHKATDKRWWAWHGLGENQLHFTGERHWWPSDGDDHAINFDLPSPDKKLCFDSLLDMLEQL